MAARSDDHGIVIERKVSITWVAAVIFGCVTWGISQYYGYRQFADTTSAAMAENTAVLKELVQQMKAKDLKDQIQDVKLAEHEIRLTEYDRILLMRKR